jgi:hypothetical protein
VSNAATDAAGGPMERFAAPPSRWFGVVAVFAAAVLAVVVLLNDPRDSDKVLGSAAIVSLVSWVVLIRPIVSANGHGVLLHNMLRDIFVPWSKIDRCRIVQTLQIVTTDEERFYGLGISRSARQMVRRRYGRSSLLTGGLGFGMGSRLNDTVEPPVNGGAPEIAYQDYVESRIRELSDNARPDDLWPVVSWAWESIAALAVAIGCLVLLLLL